MGIKTITENIKSKTFSTLYYIYGEEEYLKKHYFSQIKKVIASDFTEFNYIELSGKNFNENDFSNSINSYPVMSDKKMVSVIDFDNSTLKKGNAKEFIDCLNNIPDYCTVVFYDTDVKDLSAAKPLADVVTNIGGVVAKIDKPNISSLAAWSKKHFKSAKKDISNEDLYYLLSIADNDMLSLNNEISKLCNFTNADIITANDIDKLVTRSIDANRYEISDAFCAKKYNKVFDIIDKLYKQNIDEIVIANVFYKCFNDLLKARCALDSFKTSQQFSKDFAFNPYIASKIMKNSKVLTRDFLEKAVFASLNLDIKLKSSSLNKKELIEDYVAELISYRQIYG